MFPHRLDDDKLREIGDNPAAIFEGCRSRSTAAS
jgi:hypothetical protein